MVQASIQIGQKRPSISLRFHSLSCEPSTLPALFDEQASPPLAMLSFFFFFFVCVCVRIVTVKILVVFLFGTIGGDVLGKTWTINWERAFASVFELQHKNAICVCAFVKTEEALHRSKFSVRKSSRIQIFHNFFVMIMMWQECD